MGYRDYSTAKSLIVDTTGHGDFTTIASAITAASSGQTIFIRPGTYTENPTLKAGVNLAAFGSDSSLNATGHVIISGNCTLSTAGSVTISGIQLQTNSGAFLTVSGSAASIVNLQNCFLNCSAHTGISFSSSSGSAAINITNCTGDIGTTGISLFANTSAGTMTFITTYITNSGSSTTASTTSAGLIQGASNYFNFPLSASSTAQVFFSFQYLAGINTTVVTTTNTAIVDLNHCILSSGTASCASIGAGTTLRTKFVDAASSNTNVFTGAGTWAYSRVSFSASSSGHNVTTETPYATLN